VVNAAKLVNIQRDDRLREAVVSSDIINADGQAVIWAARFLGYRLPERVAGIDLMDRLVELAAHKKYKIFLLGAKEKVLRAVVRGYEQEYSCEILAGTRNGYFSDEEAPEVAKEIAGSGADMLFVGMSSPRKELFLDKYRQVIEQVPVVMGVGGSFDVKAGVVKRAPLWMQRAGLEWLYRLLQEPRRLWKRYLFTNTLFLLYVLREKFSRRRRSSQSSEHGRLDCR